MALKTRCHMSKSRGGSVPGRFTDQDMVICLSFHRVSAAGLRRTLAGGGRRLTSPWLLTALLLPLASGCDQLGVETPGKVMERQLAEAKAIGSACRHAVRAIEDCYVLNPKADKSAVFSGWKEMDEYMRENKLEGVAPVVPRSVAAPASAASKPAADEEGAEEEE
jgi:hypothetical protein